MCQHCILLHYLIILRKNSVLSYKSSHADNPILITKNKQYFLLLYLYNFQSNLRGTADSNPTHDYNVAIMVPLNTGSQWRSKSLSHIATLTQLGCQQGGLRSSGFPPWIGSSNDFKFLSKYYIRNQMISHSLTERQTDKIQ